MKRFALGFALVVVARTATAQDQPPPEAKPPEAKPDEPKKDEPKKDEPKPDSILEVHGYVQPQFGARHRPSALPRDRWDYGGLSSRAGIIFSGHATPQWSYIVHLSLDARTLAVLTGLSTVDRDGDGSVDSVDVFGRRITNTLFEEATIGYAPFSFLSVKMGALRLPFTVALRAANNRLLFANRPAATETFQSGSDQGILAAGDWMDGRVQGSLGVFTGTSLAGENDAREARGLLYSARFDGNPLGKLPRAEVDFERGFFRFGLGAGALYRRATLYGPEKYELFSYSDTRLSLSARMSVFGFFFQAEAIRRLFTDNITSRPNQASGAYAQASYFIPVTPSVGLAPVARFSITSEEERVLPRRTYNIEAGLACYPKVDKERPEGVRVLLQYLAERRTPEDENAHGVILQGQVLF